MLLTQFPKNIYDDAKFTFLDNTYFKYKKIDPKIKRYYNEINDFICNKEELILANVSWDYGIPYICEEKNLKNNYSAHKRFLKTLNKNEYERIVVNSNLKNNELLFTDEIIDNPKIELIKIFYSPMKPKSWYRDIRVYQSIK